MRCDAMLSPLPSYISLTLSTSPGKASQRITWTLLGSRAERLDRIGRSKSHHPRSHTNRKSARRAYRGSIREGRGGVVTLSKRRGMREDV
ncbi:hypothetical protein CBOM_07609 [Ceraceosorus bombacis]|uniref:Uncharacterized protein n=1 Tax=Ceraceosorus bombacis TaxID=401625 RepID=A0A0P1BH07_9BASI|nr:hypothetical protein CBOM_07609 [Ceraceosorus bombacis]